MEKESGEGVILMTGHRGEVLVDVNPKVVQETLFTVREASTSTAFQEPGRRLNTSD